MQIVLWIFAVIGFGVVVFACGIAMIHWIINPQTEDEKYNFRVKSIYDELRKKRDK